MEEYKYELKEELYKADLEILNKYQSFSKELTRIALICIGVIGFLLEKLIFGKPDEKLSLLQDFHKSQCLLYFSLIFLMISVACSIFHLYFSSDSLTHIISAYRLKVNGRDEKAEREKAYRNIDFRICSIILLISCITLILGIVLGAFFYTTFLP